MHYGSTLPVTGGIVLGTVVLGQTTLAAIAVGLVLGGALLVRASFRRGKSATER